MRTIRTRGAAPLLAASLALVLAACSAGTTPTPEPTAPPTAEPSVPASAAPAGSATPQPPLYPSLAPGASFLVPTTPTPEGSEAPWIDPGTSPDVAREASSWVVTFCVYGWSFDMGGPIIDGIGYDGKTPICREGRAKVGVDVSMGAWFMDRNGVVEWTLQAYKPHAANRVEVIVQQEGDDGWRLQHAVGPGGSKVFSAHGHTFKIWESGSRPDQSLNGVDVRVNLEMCVFDHCFH